jgi:hypothetical protein
VYIDRRMPSGAVRASLLLGALFAFVSCAPAAPVAAPAVATDEPSPDVAGQEARALEQRRLQLMHRVLTELHKLKESRQASAGAAEAAASDERGDDDLLVFGGASHEVFLGCLCDEERADSVFNLAGEHGSDLAPASIRNKFGPYGSNHDDTSACNPTAKRPPIVVASSGKSLGLLTINGQLKRRLEAPSLVDWLGRMCGI